MIDKVMIDGQQVELTKDMFEMAPANFGDNEAISRPSLTFWQDARKRLFKNPGALTGVNNARRDYSRVLQFNPVTLEITWQYTPLEAGNLLFTDASKFYSSYISSAQRLPNGNTLITEGSDGRLIEVTPDHEIVWEYINPYFNTILGQFTNNMVYRAYRVPYEWIPQVKKPEEISVEPIDVETFRVPGSLVGNGLGKVTTIAGVDPNARLMTGGGASEDEDEEINFCVATVKKSDLIKK